MSAQVLWCSTARRSLCSSCLLSRCTSAYYSQVAAGRVQHPEVLVSACRGARALTGAPDNCHRAVANTRNPLDPTRLDRYLESIKAAHLEPTLDDIEQCKPESFSQPDSSRYSTEYTNLSETLCRSFSKEQLRRFAELYKLDPIWTRSSRRKTEYAESIMEKAWGWPSLKEIERKRRDTTEVLVKSFTVTPSQLFLLMGRDGADLLQLSTRYNVHISLTSNPLALRVQGLRGSLKGVAEHISSLKKGIIDEISELPSGRPVRPDLLQRISRLAGAYVENHGHRGKVRICARNLGDIIAAQRLALRASLEVGTQTRTICFNPPNERKDSLVQISEPHKYSMYPFVTPSSFPWTMHPGAAFRLRRVVDWLGVGSYDNIASTGGLADSPHRLLNLDQSEVELGQLLRPPTSEGITHPRRIITASLGHILISSGDHSQRATICPPLRGVYSLLDLLKWVETSGSPLTFVPSVSSPITTANVVNRRVLHRLVYRTLPQYAGQVSKLPQHVLKVEIKLPAPISTSSRAMRDPENAPRSAVLSSDNESNWSTDPVSPQERLSQSGGLPGILTDERDFSCQVGRESYVNLMFPDRPMDVQFCAFEWDDIKSMQQPQALREYAEKFRCFLADASCLLQPDPPLTFSYTGRTYYLHDSLNVIQSNNPSLLSAHSSDCNVDDLVEVSSESIMDLQSTQNMELCQVKFNDMTDELAWSHFLAACDRLSVMSVQSRS